LDPNGEPGTGTDGSANPPEVLARQRLVELRVEHRDLDLAIARLVQTGSGDELQVRRLKKRKLQIRDTITRLEMTLVPDIPA
jgi:hypothetical protein